MASVNIRIDNGPHPSSPAPAQDNTSLLTEETALFEMTAPGGIEDNDDVTTFLATAMPAGASAGAGPAAMDVLLEETTLEVNQFEQPHQLGALDDSVARAQTNAQDKTTEQTQLDVMAKALFPVIPSSTNGLKRLSLPVASSLSTLDVKRSSLIPQPTKQSDQTTMTTRKSLSPTHARQRRDSTTQDHHGTLLDMSLVAQMHALKARNAALEKSLSTAAQSQSTELFKATSRIQTLEQQLTRFDKVQLESEGWEAEATRLTTELDQVQSRLDDVVKSCTTADKKLKAETIKRKKYKSLSQKLQAELLNRKWKEKWELCLMDCQDRDRDQRQVELEAQVSLLRMQVGIANLDMQDLEETIEQYKVVVSELTASRQSLLDQVKLSEGTIATLKAQATSSQKDGNKEMSAIKEELSSAKIELAAAVQRADELEKQVGEVDELREQVAQLESEVKNSDKNNRKVEAKEVAEAKKMASKETQRREKVEEECKALKTTIKQLEADLANTKKAATAKPSPLSASNEEGATVYTVAFKSKSVSKTAKKQKPVEPSSPEVSIAVHEEELEDNGEDKSDVEDEAEPVAVQKKTKTAVASKPALTASKKRPAMLADESGDEDSVVRAVPTVKKRKANGDTLGVLADKTASKTNVKEKPSSLAGLFSNNNANKKSASSGGGVEGLFDKLKKKANAETVVAPVKPKKRTLAAGGGGRKLDWMKSIETADVNGLGLPSMLSPIKPTATKGTKLGGLGGLRGGSSIFGHG
ncbi:hypothetical protein OIV83_003698 [Microbotryomycetes sp. JL201]|nr:hypothetical protein OIV83_003698 [Microbotryomycetes sp. JL201]